MPERVIDKPPTAELRANQKDEDTLPPYAILDGILECLVEREMSFEEVVAKGYEAATVKRVEQLLYVAEYKRRQAPPGVKLSTRSFGRDRRSKLGRQTDAGAGVDGRVIAIQAGQARHIEQSPRRTFESGQASNRRRDGRDPDVPARAIAAAAELRRSTDR